MYFLKHQLFKLVNIIGPCLTVLHVTCLSILYTRYGGGPPRFGGGGGGNRGGPPPGKFGNPGERLRKKHWNLDELPKFQKNFYQEHPDVTRRPLVRTASLLDSHRDISTDR